MPLQLVLRCSVIVIIMHLVTSIGNFSLTDECINRTEIIKRAEHFGCIDPKKYHYLWNSSKNTFTEGCFQSQFVPAGKMTRLDTQCNCVDTRECPEETFQPTAYDSHTQSCCESIKSKCNETGSEVYSNGSTSVDRSCVCDYRRNYAPKFPLNNNCFCIPREEDCTCIFVPCGEGSMLTPDYECVKKEVFQNISFKCNTLPDDSQTLTKDIAEDGGQTNTTNTTECRKSATSKNGVKGIIVELLAASVVCIVCFFLGIGLEKKLKISGYIKTSLSTFCARTCSRTEAPTTKSDGSEIGDKENSKRNKNTQDDADNDNIDEIELMEEASCPVFTSHNMEYCYEPEECDIIIISTGESRTKAIPYLQHLETLKEKFDMPSIKLRLMASERSIFEETLKSCRHIFIYVTEMFSMNTFKEEVDFDHLKEKYFEDHTNIDRIKIVCVNNTMIPEELCALNTIPFHDRIHSDETYNTRMKHYFSKILMKDNPLYEQR